ncbi:MAG: hypothetical protein EAZ42_02335 [Verrucomicrobia bacterium]|nr:MAG: hypothetical protein EAZ42_02335 [Verrucomicrobiota bacterium]
MSKKQKLQEELELEHLAEIERALLAREKECSDLPKKLAKEKRDLETMMPPLAEISHRVTLKHHEETVTRGAVSNTLRDQNRSIMLLLLLMIATGCLIWWAYTIIQPTH